MEGYSGTPEHRSPTMVTVAEKVKNLIARLGRPGPYDVNVGDLGVAGLAGRVYVPVSGTGGAARIGRRGRASVPGLVFGHDWKTGVDAYDGTLRHLASWGIAVAAPDTERGLLPDHRGFAADLESALQILTGVKLGTGNVVVDPARLYLSGHGMGAGAAVLAATGRVAADPAEKVAKAGKAAKAGPETPTLAGVISVYPSDTTPSCYQAARQVEAAGLVLGAGKAGAVPAGNARRLAANWRGPVVYRTIDRGAPAGLPEPLLRKALVGGSGPQFAVQSLIRALMVGFIAGDGAVDTTDAKACRVLRDAGTSVPATTTQTRRELIESLPEFGDITSALQQAVLKR